MWAWANQSILPDLSRDSRSFCDWAEANGHPALAQPEVNVDEQAASTLVAVTVRITGAIGYSKGPGGNSSVITTFGPVTLTKADGSISTFKIDINERRGGANRERLRDERTWPQRPPRL